MRVFSSPYVRRHPLRSCLRRHHRCEPVGAGGLIHDPAPRRQAHETALPNQFPYITWRARWQQESMSDCTGRIEGLPVRPPGGPLIGIDDAEYAIATIGAERGDDTMKSLPMEGRWAPFRRNGFFLSCSQGDERRRRRCPPLFFPGMGRRHFLRFSSRSLWSALRPARHCGEWLPDGRSDRTG